VRSALLSELTSDRPCFRNRFHHPMPSWKKKRRSAECSWLDAVLRRALHSKPSLDLLLRVPASSLFELEERLYEPRFMNVPIGAALTDLLKSRFDIRPVAALRSFVAWARYSCFGPRTHGGEPFLEPDRVLVTWLVDTRRYNDFVPPVLDELGCGQFNVIGGVESLRESVPAGVGFCTYADIEGADRAVWRREYLRCRGAWHREVLRWLREHRLPLRLFPCFAYAMEERAFYVAGFLGFLERVRPTLVLTDSEHNTPWNCLILAARELRIPTLHMIHGVIYPPFGYTPLLSDALLCWGEQHREQMIALGTEAERLVIAGCQRLSRELCADRASVRARLGLPVDRHVVMLATGPMLMSEWRKLMFAFGDAFLAAHGPLGVVRLHAAERLENYRGEIAKYPRLRFFENQSWSVDEAMAACDVVVIHNSGLGNDALVMGRPVVLLDVLSAPLGNGRVLADRAGCPVAGSADELRRIVDRIADDAEYRVLLRNKAEEYVRWFCAAFGRDAARNVAKEVRRRIKPLVQPAGCLAAPSSGREARA
jgi:hypothetical protein